MLTPCSRIMCVLDYVVLFGFCALQFAFVFGLPWFDSGVRPRIEGPTIVLHFASALLALGVGVQMALKNERYIRASLSPVVIALFAFALLSAAFAPLTSDPARSLNGTVKHGIGVYWHLEFALATLAAGALWSRVLFRRSMVLVAGLAALIIVCTYTFTQNTLGTPLAFSEWVGILTLAVASASFLAIVDERTSGGRWSAARIAIVLFAVCLVISGYVVSGNRAVLLAVFSVAAFLLAGKLSGIGKVVSSPVMRAMVVVSTTVAVSGGLYFVGPIIEKISVSQGENQFPSITSEAPIDQVAIQAEAMGTIWSRSYLERVQIDDILSHPETLLYGNGFGHFGTIYEYGARQVPGRLFPIPTDTASRLYWDAHNSANFHSHNMLSEMLSSTGLTGAVLWLTAFALMAWSSVRGAAISLGIVVIGSLWFPMNLMMGSIALLVAASIPLSKAGCGNPLESAAKSTVAAGAGSLIAVFGFVLFALMGYSSVILGKLEHFERAFIPVEVNTDRHACGFLKTRLFSEREIVVELYAILQNKIERAADPKKVAFDSTTNLISMNCMLRRYFEEKGDIRSLVTSLKGRSSLVSLGPSSYGGLQNEIVKWGNDLELLLDAAPSRTELIAPYITALNQRAPQKVPQEITRFLRRTEAHDPIRHYLFAMQAKSRGDDAQYSEFFSEALKHGLANLWPVTAAKPKENIGASNDR